MHYVRLGKSGLVVSRLCLGCMTYGDPARGWNQWVLDREQSLPFYRQALELGINFFDTANTYSAGGSEEVLGVAMREFARRDEVVIATKVGSSMSSVPGGPMYPNGAGLSRKHILSAIDASLQRLQMDYIDIYHVHKPDQNTPIEETMEALSDIVRAGKVRYIGASNFHAWQLVKAQYQADRHGWPRFVSMQSQYNLLYREEENEMYPYCIEEGIGILPWSPLARGFLAGNRHGSGGGDTARAQLDPTAKHMYYRPADFRVTERLFEVAGARQEKPMKVALAWLLGKPGITAPLIGASKPHHLTDAVEALQLRLSEEEVRRLEEPYEPRRRLGPQ